MIQPARRDILLVGAHPDLAYFADFLTAEDYIYKVVTSADAMRAMLRQGRFPLVFISFLSEPLQILSLLDEARTVDASMPRLALLSDRWPGALAQSIQRQANVVLRYPCDLFELRADLESLLPAKNPAERLAEEQRLRVGSQVSRLRKARGWTLKQLASHTGLPVPMLVRIELGKGYPSRADIGSLETALETKLT